MEKFWFVVLCPILLVAFGLIVVSSEAIDKDTKDYVRDAASFKAVDGPYGQFENVVWSVLYRMVGASMQNVIIVGFVTASVWQWTLAAYGLGPWWQIAYVTLACFALLATLAFDKPGSTVVLAQWVIIIGMLLMIVHIVGIGLGIAEFTVPALHLDTPAITIPLP